MNNIWFILDQIKLKTFGAKSKSGRKIILSWLFLIAVLWLRFYLNIPSDLVLAIVVFVVFACLYIYENNTARNSADQLED